MTTATKTQKQVKVLARVQYKNNPHIIAYFVLSSDGVTIYKTIFSHGKLAGCTCPAGHKCCYHGKQLTEIENAHQQPVLTPAAPAVETFPLIAVLQEAQAAMVLFDRQVKSGLAAADAYELIAEMRKAVAEAPSFVERFRDERPGCEFCGGRHASHTCPF